MEKPDFYKWRTDLMSFDRYENKEDGKSFVELARKARGQFDEDVIGVLLDTFCNEDDYVSSPGRLITRLLNNSGLSCCHRFRACCGV